MKRRSAARTSVELAAGPQPGQRQRRVRPPGHHQPQRRRQVGQQELDALVDPPVAEHVVVVQHQQVLPVAGRLSSLSRSGQREVDRGQAGGGERGQRRRPDRGHARLQRGQHVAPEAARLVVRLVQRHPGHRPALRRVVRPLGEQRRLSPAGRGDDGDQPGVGAGQPLVQPAADDRARPARRHRALGRQQRGGRRAGALGHRRSRPRPDWTGRSVTPGGSGVGVVRNHPGGRDGPPSAARRGGRRRQRP